VQDRIQGFDPLATASDRRNSGTVGCELGNWIGTGQRRWTIASDKDVGPVAVEMAVEIKAVLLPFIERFSDLTVLLKTLVSDMDAARLISPIDDKRRKTVEALQELQEG
jgi:hypothetical protein